MSILFSLAIPWFLRTMISGAWTTEAKIQIFSHGIEFTIIGLILAVVTLYITLASAGYQLRREIGFILIASYLILATLAILLEFDIFFDGSDRC